MRASIALLAALVLTTSCYTIRASAPPGTTTTFAAAGEACVPIAHRRVHYALAGLVPIGDNEVIVPGNARVRVETQADAVDMLLRAVGAVFTWGLYGGTASATVEVCQAPVLSGPPGMTSQPATYPLPQPEVPAPAPYGWSVPGPGPVVPAPGPRRPVRDSNQPMCQSSLDCGPGGWCKDRGDGVQLCMNHGDHDDFCQSALDCGSGLFCQKSGDGFMRCM